MQDIAKEFPHAVVDCVMLGDSLLSTHFKFGDTILDTRNEQRLFLKAFVAHLDEIKKALDGLIGPKFAPYLIADMPFGTAIQVESALRNAEFMCRYGANVVKLEAFSDDVLDVIEELSSSGYTVMGHIGYTPQVGGRKSRGVTYQDAVDLCKMARRVRDAGAQALVLEGVASRVHAALSKYSPKGIPTYGIFSGRAVPGGLSINVWDAVVRPGFKARFFPPTAQLVESEVPHGYSQALVAEKIKEVLRLIYSGAWPLERVSEWSADEVAQFEGSSPWADQKA